MKSNYFIENFNIIKTLSFTFSKKNLKSYMFLFFSFVFPILIMIIFFFVFGKQTNRDDQINFTLSFIPAEILISAASIGLGTAPFLFGIDRISGKNKIFASLNIKKTSYFISLYISCFLLYFFIVNVQLLILDYGFIFGTLNAQRYFSLLFTNIYIFSIFFIISLYLGSKGKRVNQLFLIINIYFFINLFFSGITIPTVVIDPNSIIPVTSTTGQLSFSASYWKWVQYFTPAGCGSRLSEIIVLPNSFATWSTDWIAIISPIVQGIIAFFIFRKKFKWVI